MDYDAPDVPDVPEASEDAVDAQQQPCCPLDTTSFWSYGVAHAATPPVPSSEGAQARAVQRSAARDWSWVRTAGVSDEDDADARAKLKQLCTTYLRLKGDKVISMVSQRVRV